MNPEIYNALDYLANRPLAVSFLSPSIRLYCERANGGLTVGNVTLEVKENSYAQTSAISERDYRLKRTPNYPPDDDHLMGFYRVRTRSKSPHLTEDTRQWDRSTRYRGGVGAQNAEHLLSTVERSFYTQQDSISTEKTEDLMWRSHPLLAFTEEEEEEEERTPSASHRYQTKATLQRFVTFHTEPDPRYPLPPVMSAVMWWLQRCPVPLVMDFFLTPSFDAQGWTTPLLLTLAPHLYQINVRTRGLGKTPVLTPQNQPLWTHLTQHTKKLVVSYANGNIASLTPHLMYLHLFFALFPIGETVEERLTTLREVSIVVTNLVNLDFLSENHHLTRLYLQEAYSFCRVFNEKGSCKGLTELHLVEAFVLENLKGLEDHPSLRVVRLTRCLQLKDASALLTCPQLEEVHNFYCPITQWRCSPRQHHCVHRSLRVMTGVPFTRDLFKVLSTFKVLEVLALHTSDHSMDNIEEDFETVLAPLRKTLKYISLREVEEERVVRFALSLQGVTHMELDMSDLVNDVFLSISPQVERLTMQSFRQNIDWRPPTKNQSLLLSHFTANHFATVQNFSVLASYRLLEDLDLTDCCVAELTFLHHLPFIKSLVLNKVVCEDGEGFGPIKSLNKLELLEARHTKITDTDLEGILHSTSSLITLDLSFCNLLTRLPKKIHHLQRLRVLFLRGCTRLSNAVGLQCCPVLELLDVSGCTTLHDFAPLLQSRSIQTILGSGWNAPLPPFNPLEKEVPCFYPSWVRRLDLSEHQVLRDVTTLAFLPFLQELKLDHTPISALCTAEVTNHYAEQDALHYLFPALRRASLVKCRFLVDIDALSCCEYLFEVNLDGCSLLSSIDQLFSCPRVSFITISECTSLEEVGWNRQLKGLDCSEYHYYRPTNLSEGLTIMT